MKCTACGNEVGVRTDPTGQRGEAWAEQSWGDDRDFQCGLSLDGRHHGGEPSDDSAGNKDGTRTYAAGMSPLSLTPWQAHALIKACEAINNEAVSGLGLYRQDEMEEAQRLIPRLAAIADNEDGTRTYAVTYTFVVEAGPDQHLADAVEEYIHSGSGALDQPDRVEELDDDERPGWLDADDVLGVATDALPGVVRQGQAGGTLMVRCYLPDGRNIIITDGDSGGEPFSGLEPAQHLYLGLYASTQAADDGEAAVKVEPLVPADRSALALALLLLAGLPMQCSRCRDAVTYDSSDSTLVGSDGEPTCPGGDRHGPVEIDAQASAALAHHHTLLDADGDSLFPQRPLDEDEVAAMELDAERGPWFEVLRFSRTDFGGAIVQCASGAALHWTDYVANGWTEYLPSTSLAIVRLGVLFDGANRGAFYTGSLESFSRDAQTLMNTYLDGETA